MGSIQYHDGSSFQAISSGALKYHNGTEFKTVAKGYYHNGVDWVEFYTGTDQVTYYFLADSAKGARGSSWSTSSTLGGTRPKTGRFSTNYPWYGLANFEGVTSFTALDSDGAARTNLTLEQALADRTVVKSASIKIRRVDSPSHGFTGGGNPYPGGWGTINIGTYSGSISATNPSVSNVSFTDFASIVYAGRSGPAPGALPLGGIAEIDLNSNGHLTDLVNHAATGVMSIANTTDTGSTSGTPGGLNNFGTSSTLGLNGDSSYFFFNDHTDTVGIFPVGPQLIVTLDYS